MSLAPSKCALCGVEASLKCAGCKRVVYCSPEHQKKHWKRQHKNECAKPYEVKLRGRGRKLSEKLLGDYPELIGVSRWIEIKKKFNNLKLCRIFTKKNLLYPQKKEKFSQVRMNFSVKWTKCIYKYFNTDSRHTLTPPIGKRGKVVVRMKQIVQHTGARVTSTWIAWTDFVKCWRMLYVVCTTCFWWYTADVGGMLAFFFFWHTMFVYIRSRLGEIMDRCFARCLQNFVEVLQGLDSRQDSGIHWKF